MQVGQTDKDQQGNKRNRGNRRDRRDRRNRKNNKIGNTNSNQVYPLNKENTRIVAPSHVNTLNSDSWANRLKRGYTGQTGTTIQHVADQPSNNIMVSTVDTNVIVTPIVPVSYINLPSSYILWSHNVNVKDWGINSYKKHCTLKTTSEFWQVINNFNKLDARSYHFYLMKEGIAPTWEDSQNRNGGTCSFKVEMNTALSLWEKLSTLMVCNQLIDDHNDITGLSISCKNSWAIIKVWNSKSTNDLSVLLDASILNNYGNSSIKYKPNAPEY